MNNYYGVSNGSYTTDSLAAWELHSMDPYQEFDVSITESRIRRTLDKRMGIRKVIFNEPATIVFWSDGDKTVVKCKKGEIFDPEIGLMAAYIKHLYNDVMGSNASYRKQFTSAARIYYHPDKRKEK